MNSPKFAACLEDVQRWAAERDAVKVAIVYGSVSRSTAVDASDLDLFVIAPRNRHDALARDLHLLGARHDVRVSPYILERGELGGLDRQFLESIARDGLVLKGRPLDPTVRELDLRPHYLVTLYLNHLSQRTKVRFSRELYGYRTSRRYKRATYESRSEGFLDRVGGRKLGRGTVLVPARAWPDLEALITKFRGKRWAFPVWVQGP